MKLLVVAPYFYPKIGGLENFAWQISKGFKKKYKWDIVVITSNHVSNSYNEEKIEGIKIYRLPAIIKLSNTPINPFWLFTINKIVDKEKPDIINGHTPVPFISDIAAIVAKSKNIPYILMHHNDLAKNNPILNFIIKLYYIFLGNKTAQSAKYIIASSEFYAKKSFLLKQHPHKIKIVQPGVDLHFYNAIKVSNKLQSQYKNKKIVLFVGQLDKTHEHKGLPYLIESVAKVKNKIKNIKLIVIGKGDMVNKYKSQGENLGIKDNIEFLENINNEELVQYYKLSDVVVLPSINESEGFGMVLIEAGACKKPVIGTRVGGIPYIVKNNQNGLLIKPRNTADIVNGLLEILLNKQKANRFGLNGYKIVSSEYQWKFQVDKYKNILYETIN